MTLALLTFIAIFMLIASGALLYFYRGVVLSRLSTVVSPSAGPQNVLERFLGVQPTTASIEEFIDPFQKILPRSPEEVGVTQKRLILAGYRKESHVNIFYGAKVVVPVFLCVLATVTRFYQHGPLFVYGLAGGLGFLLPDFWLGNRISARQLKIRLC